MRFEVPIEIHAHEAMQLQESRIDITQETRIRKRHLGNDVAAKPGGAALFCEPVHHGRVDPRVDWAAHQHHAMRDVRIILRFHARDRGQHRHRRLAYRHHMHAAAKKMQHRDQVIDVIVEIERSFGERHHPGVDPLGQVNVVIGEKPLDGAPQQRRIVAGHGGDDGHARLGTARRMLEDTLEMQEPAERPFPDSGEVNRHPLAADRY